MTKEQFQSRCEDLKAYIKSYSVNNFRNEALVCADIINGIKKFDPNDSLELFVESIISSIKNSK